MRIDNQDIARMARQLRDEQNSQQHVRPWSRKRRPALPAWLVAVPAAAIVGFVLGLWTNAHTQSGAPLMALTDTVYINVKDAPDTVRAAETAELAQSTPASSTLRTSGRKADSRSASRRHDVPTGQPIQSDHIRYDLLVKN